ncbi:hypothetical protein RIF29_17777 [Crotalaria pallida]|uniref:Uncharacterized protein n=1 Tax=Crotalaria pallida TaxID=3830 RepID=A0AAN9FJ16_CROPI
MRSTIVVLLDHYLLERMVGNIFVMFVAVAAVTIFLPNPSEQVQVLELRKRYRKIKAEIRRERAKGKMLDRQLRQYGIPSIDKMNLTQLLQYEAALKRLRQQLLQKLDEDSTNTTITTPTASIGDTKP